MVMLKSFQRLGYFTHPELVPQPIIIHLRTCLKLDYQVSPVPSLRSIRYYQEAIREYLNISPYNNRGQELAAVAIRQQWRDSFTARTIFRNCLCQYQRPFPLTLVVLFPLSQSII